MAGAPGHALGQLIGRILESATEPVLRELAHKHQLYLDSGGPRPGIRAGSRLCLVDAQGNTHALDFVLERDGALDKQGQYAAFIECAWRRVTKQSKNKAQEIQAAVLPLLAKWSTVGPVPAAVVAGRWSRPATKQLESCGFVVLQLDFDSTVDVFDEFGVNIRGPDGVESDQIPDAFWSEQLERLRGLSESELRNLATALRQANDEDFRSFIQDLQDRIVRTVSVVRFHPVHGRSYEFGSLSDAIEAMHSYDVASVHPLIRFEFEVEYTNGDTIRGAYSSAEAAEEFLRALI